MNNDEGAVDHARAFGKADFFAMNYLIANYYDDLTRFNCYLDNIFGAFNPRDTARSEAAIPLALHLMGRPVETHRWNLSRETISSPYQGKAIRAKNDPRLGG